MKVPAHISIIMELPISQRTIEERDMLGDFYAKRGDYGHNGKFAGEQANLFANNSGWSGHAGGSEWNNKVFKRCYEDHPALPIIMKDGTERLVYGGSCSSPIHDDADIYIGLDMSMRDHPQRFPWMMGEAIHYIITDGSIPKNLGEFRVLIEWTAAQIDAGQKVHIGCIGGHGRTGMVLAALVAHMSDEEDAIAYVRTNYCKKAVESKIQVDMLMNEYGCKTAKGSKEHHGKGFGGMGGYGHNKSQTVASVKAPHTIWPDYDLK